MVRADADLTEEHGQSHCVVNIVVNSGGAKLLVRVEALSILAFQSIDMGVNFEIELCAALRLTEENIPEVLIPGRLIARALVEGTIDKVSVFANTLGGSEIHGEPLLILRIELAL